jgi:phosphomannomutase
VGEAHVVDGMIANQAILGGEGNGGVMDPRVGWVRDPFVGMTLVLGSLALSGRRLQEAIAALPPQVIIKDKTPLQKEKLPGWLAALKGHWPTWAADERDGLRLECAEGWIQVRASNTEPIARIIAESSSGEEARGWIREAIGLMPR